MTDACRPRNSQPAKAPAGEDRQGREPVLGREIATRESPANLMQIRFGVVAFGRAFWLDTKLRRVLGEKSEKLGACHAQEFGECQHLHCFLHRL